MVEAKYYEQVDGKVKCLLCPHYCVISEGKHGICRVRKNENGKLNTDIYGMLVARHMDPIEKKPLYHFYPGSRIMSIGTPGCNLRCFFCQNCGISQVGSESFSHVNIVYPDEIVGAAIKEKNNIGIAYTYNEPTVYFEYMVDTAKLARQKNLINVMVSNGFITPAPLDDLIEVIDAFNIDLKAFTDEFYKKYTRSRLDPVKESLLQIHKSGRHLEITFLVIPGLNDDEYDFRNMIEWLADNFGRSQVLHLSRYFPNYQSEISPTPVSTLQKFREIAVSRLSYVFLGNTSVSEGQDSYCYNCGKMVIERDFFSVNTYLDKNGNCLNCNSKILSRI